MTTVFRWMKSAPGTTVPFHRWAIFDEFLTLESRVSDDLLKKSYPNDEERLARARFWWLALEFRKSVRDSSAVVAGRGLLEVEAALATIDGLLACGRADDAVETFEKVLARHRDHAGLIARGAALLLDCNDARGEQLAAEIFARKTAEAGPLGLHWSAYHFRRRQWERAGEILDRFEDIVFPLPADLADEIARTRRDIDACKSSPAAFKRIHGRTFVARLIGWGVPLVVLLLIAWSAYLVGPVFFQEARTLKLLQERGVEVDASHLRELRRRDAGRAISELTYAFSPDPATGDSWELQLPETYSREAIDALINRARTGELPRGWYRGSSLLYTGTAKSIERDDSRQIVTFLADDPTVNAVGPISWTRVWFTWLAAGDAIVMVVAMVGVTTFLMLQATAKRLRRWAAGKRPL